MNTRTTARHSGHSIATRVGTVAAAGALILGLAACQTGVRESQPQPAPKPRPAAVAPSGIDRNMTADRIVEALERREAASTDRFSGMTADGIDRMLAREGGSSDRFSGMTADNIERILEREAADAPVAK